jgi:L-fuculose-phosphate aldolase
MHAEALAEAYQALGRAGLIAGSSGNISLRTPDGMLISPTGTSPECIAAADVVAMTLGHPAPRASSEWELHGSLYRDRPDIGAIVHTHADACTALACLNEGLPLFHYDVLAFGGPVSCAPYVTFGTRELAALAVEAMADRTACLLANHGMIAAGATLEKAVAAAFQLERLCRQYLLARAAGTPRLLTEPEAAAARERFQTYRAP